MIQRIQSLWLLLAAAASALLYKWPIYGGELLAGGNREMLIRESLLLLIVNVVLVLFPLVALAQFKNSSNQKKLIYVSLLLQAVFIGLIWMEANEFAAKFPLKKGGYHLAATLPVVAMVLLLLALSGIRKDEKLIKSADRLR